MAIKKISITAAIVAILGAGVTFGFLMTSTCPDDHYQLDFLNENGVVTESRCLNGQDYKDLKEELRVKLRENAAYEIDINLWSTYLAVWKAEIEKRGNVQLDGLSKEKLKQTLVDLLN